MQDATLQRAGVDAATLQLLANRRLASPHDILSTLPLDLMELLDLPLPAVEGLLRAVAAALLPRPVTALDLARLRLAQPAHLPTQLEALDVVLRGGCGAGSLTEVVGPAGIGKTQLCLQLAAIAACLHSGASGTQPGVVCYIDTERRFRTPIELVLRSAKRFLEIITQRFPGQHAGHAAQEALLRRVQVSTPLRSTDLLQELQALESGRAARDNVGLVVVDSIAALTRHDTDQHVADKQQLIGHQAAVLKSLAERCNIPVFVSNQITTAFQRPSHTFEAATNQGQGGSYLTAALGPQWAHAVNTRLVLEASNGVRWIKVAKSPVAPVVAFAFEIGGAGLQLLDRDAASVAAVGGTLALPVSNEIF